eukprot:754718-Pleurochrysis_carterae.AAC.1
MAGTIARGGRGRGSFTWTWDQAEEERPENERAIGAEDGAEVMGGTKARAKEERWMRKNSERVRES